MWLWMFHGDPYIGETLVGAMGLKVLLTWNFKEYHTEVFTCTLVSLSEYADIVLGKVVLSVTGLAISMSLSFHFTILYPIWFIC